MHSWTWSVVLGLYNIQRVRITRRSIGDTHIMGHGKSGLPIRHIKFRALLGAVPPDSMRCLTVLGGVGRLKWGGRERLQANRNVFLKIGLLVGKDGLSLLGVGALLT